MGELGGAEGWWKEVGELGKAGEGEWSWGRWEGRGYGRPGDLRRITDDPELGQAIERTSIVMR